MSSEQSTRTTRSQSKTPNPPLPIRSSSCQGTPTSSPETQRSKALPVTKEDIFTPNPSTSQLPHPTPPPPASFQRMTDTPKEVSTKLNTEGLKFSGTKADYRAWKDKIDLYMIGNPSQFPDDTRKMAFTLSWICGTKDAQIWASNKQSELKASSDWGTWEDFEDILEDSFGDLAAKTQAHEYLLKYRQDNAKARPFFTTLELWFNLARITNPTAKYTITKRIMNP
jgi:hypothetical protein